MMLTQRGNTQVQEGGDVNHSTMKGGLEGSLEGRCGKNVWFSEVFHTICCREGWWDYLNCSDLCGILDLPNDSGRSKTKGSGGCEDSSRATRQKSTWRSWGTRLVKTPPRWMCNPCNGWKQLKKTPHPSGLVAKSSLQQYLEFLAREMFCWIIALEKITKQPLPEDIL